ncbi:hypothetical protein Ciccas_014620 [Cichlidogyrus casuarinus]|uniref:Uncharacterized protein n=1 Tax=Cichlidogyrus casuarinus TaxID=1844966 RepID=A0ABD2PI14_9PLAT
MQGEQVHPVLIAEIERHMSFLDEGENRMGALGKKQNLLRDVNLRQFSELTNAEEDLLHDMAQVAEACNQVKTDLGDQVKLIYASWIENESPEEVVSMLENRVSDARKRLTSISMVATPNTNIALMELQENTKTTVEMIACAQAQAHAELQQLANDRDLTPQEKAVKERQLKELLGQYQILSDKLVSIPKEPVQFSGLALHPNVAIVAKFKLNLFLFNNNPPSEP